MRKYIYSFTTIFFLLVVGIAGADAIDIQFPDGPVTIDTFDPQGGWGNASLLTIGSRILAIVFGLLLVAWIFIIIFAAIRIIRQPGEEGLKAGSKRIQNVFIGISIGLGFFVAISFLGTLSGIGNIFQWSDSLQECSCDLANEDDPCYYYKFQAEASREDNVNSYWYCYPEGDSRAGKGWRFIPFQSPK